MFQVQTSGGLQTTGRQDRNQTITQEGMCKWSEILLMQYFYNHVKNYEPFDRVCRNNFGRKVIFTNKNKIDGSNIADELAKAIPVHQVNAREIDYLDGYYRGDQPILYRSKEVRPEVNNKIVENLAYMIVETKVAEMVGEPIQYVLRGTEEDKSEQLAELNDIMESEDKPYYDISLCRWRSICGTAFRYIGNDEGHNPLMDETDFCLHTEDPRYTFVAYYNDGNPAFSCQIREDEENRTVYMCFTNTEWFKIMDGKVVKSGVNGNYAIPVIEYPNNERRISDIEITIGLTDEINKMASDRSNGIEQFVSSWIKFINCEIDPETFARMRLEGALVVKSNNGSDNKADVDVMTTELNQTESQVAVSDHYEKLLVIQGIANRNSTSSGDTQGAVTLRNGWFEQEQRAEIAEPVFKRAEKKMLRIILNRLRINRGCTLTPKDVEIKIPRSKADNMQVKAQTLQMLLTSGINSSRAIKTCGLFSDPEQVAIESRKRMEILYPETQPTQQVEEVAESTVLINQGDNGKIDTRDNSRE